MHAVVIDYIWKFYIDKPSVVSFNGICGHNGVSLLDFSAPIWQDDRHVLVLLGDTAFFTPQLPKFHAWKRFAYRQRRVRVASGRCGTILAVLIIFHNISFLGSLMIRDRPSTSIWSLLLYCSLWIGSCHRILLSIVYLEASLFKGVMKFQSITFDVLRILRVMHLATNLMRYWSCRYIDRQTLSLTYSIIIFSWCIWSALFWRFILVRFAWRSVDCTSYTIELYTPYTLSNPARETDKSRGRRQTNVRATLHARLTRMRSDNTASATAHGQLMLNAASVCCKVSYIRLRKVRFESVVVNAL
jgi:hypothetical protein